MTTRTIEMPRRTLLAGAVAAAGAAVAAGPARAARIAGLSGNAPLATGGIADWRAAIGKIFVARTEHGAIALRLAAVDPLPALGARPASLARDHGFAARFEAAAGPLPAGDRTYRLSGAGHAPLDVYFNAKAKALTAIFN
jgi:hypothetical protein